MPKKHTCFYSDSRATRWARGLVSKPSNSRRFLCSNILERQWIIRQLCVLPGANPALWSLLWRLGQQNNGLLCCDSMQHHKNKSDSKVVLKPGKAQIDSSVIHGFWLVERTLGLALRWHCCWLTELRTSWDSLTWVYNRCGLKTSCKNCDTHKVKVTSSCGGGTNSKVCFYFSSYSSVYTTGILHGITLSYAQHIAQFARFKSRSSVNNSWLCCCTCG